MRWAIRSTYQCPPIFVFPSLYLAANCHLLQSPELQAFDISLLSFFQVNEWSKSRSSLCHHVQIDKNSQPCKTDTKYIQSIMKWSFFFLKKKRFYLFTHERHTQREAVTQAEGEADSPQGAQCRTGSWNSGTTP